MSVYALQPTGREWPTFQYQAQSMTSLDQQGGSDFDLGYGRVRISMTDAKPLLRSHKSFPHSIGASTIPSALYQSSSSQVPKSNNRDVWSSSGREHGRTTAILPAPTVDMSHGNSVPTSPTSHNAQLTPVSAGGEQEDGFEEEDEMTNGEQEDDGGENGMAQTAAERRAEKRKMKRFRLTHNQTRFLMSEFARQAHPDSAQRERLSREIPGLTPRQVQVWFQNRRAKLKRLTSDDRERMMKSRALPDDFDMTHTLHSPFGSIPHHFANQVGSPGSYAPGFQEGGVSRLMTMDHLRRQSEDDGIISPLTMGPPFSNYYSPSSSVPASENISPISPMSERTNFTAHSMSLSSSPRRPNPFARSSSFSTTTYNPHPYIPRLPSHDRLQRARADSLASPLRSSMSHANTPLDYGNSRVQPSVPIFKPTPWDTSRGNAGNEVDGSYSPRPLGTLQSGFQPPTLPGPPSSTGNGAPGLNLRHQYRSFHASSYSQNYSAHSGLQSAPLAPPHDFQLPQVTGRSTPAAETENYALMYGESGPYSQEQPRNEKPATEPMENRYNSNDRDNMNQPPATEASNNTVMHLPPGFSTGRRRSFTHPMDFNGPQQ